MTPDRARDGAPGRAPRRDHLRLALLAALAILPGIGARSLWNPDEPRYTEVAREMRLDGQWFLPHVNGEVYSEKPPLLFWLMNLAATATGRLDETAARLPSAAAGIGATLLVLWLGTRLFDRRTGWLAALAYLATVQTLWQARVGRIDMILGALVALAMACWVHGWQEDRPGWRLAFFAVAGVGTLAKGPVALLPALLAIVAFLLWERDRAELRRLPLGRGLLIWAAVVLAWLVPAVITGGEEYFRRIVLKQNLTRYATPWHHFQAWHYYLSSALPATFQPWLLFLPAALLAWRRELAEPLAEEDRRLRSGLRLAACWVAVTVIFFSLSPGKREVYIFQMFPGLALLLGAGIALASRRPAAYRLWLAAPALILGAALLAAPAAIPGQWRRHPELAPLGPDLPTLASALALLLGLGLLAAGVCFLRRRLVAGTVTIAASFLVGLLAAFLVLLPRFDPLKTARGLSETLLREAAPEEPYAIYPRFDAPFVFYTQRYSVPITGKEELRAFLARPGTVWLLIERGALSDLDPPLGARPDLVEVDRDADLLSGYLLLRKDPVGSLDPPDCDPPELSPASEDLPAR